MNCLSFISFPRACSINKLIILILLVMPAVSSAGVFPEQNDIALKGVTAFDAAAGVNAVYGVEEVINRSSFQIALNDAFVLGLRRDGVEVTGSAPNHLTCIAKIGGNGPGLIVYSLNVSFYDYASEGLNTLLWETGGIFVVGSDNLNAKDAGQRCVDMFASAWLEQNPK
jgi:hypothetical protein